MTPTLNPTKVSNIVFDDIDHSDYPDYCDACVVSAEYDGQPMTEEQIEDFNENYRDYWYEKLMDWIF